MENKSQLRTGSILVITFSLFLAAAIAIEVNPDYNATYNATFNETGNVTLLPDSGNNSSSEGPPLNESNVTGENTSASELNSTLGNELLGENISGVYTGPEYPIMHPDKETLEKWIEEYNAAPKAYINPEIANMIAAGYPEVSSTNLLPYIDYDPTERNQGSCGNCWAWTSTGALEVALGVQKGVRDRLSVQYINSCEYGIIGINCCAGGNLNYFANFISDSRISRDIPWSNTNAYWQDGILSAPFECYFSPSCSSISTIPYYPVLAASAQTVTTQGVSQATAISNIKNVLNQNKAVYFSFFLPNTADWNTFFNFWNNHQETELISYNYSCDHTYDSGGGGHAVLIVGYNDTAPDPYWIVLNSWGTTAGRPNGLFRVNMSTNYNCQIQYYGSPEYSLGFQTLNVTLGGSAADIYEPDETMSTAKWIPTDGTIQEHTFMPVGEYDLVKFNATLGTTYVMETSVDDVSDTVLFLYDTSGYYLYIYDDDSGVGLASQITWTNTLGSGTYYLMVRDYFNNGSSYTIHIAQPDAYEPDAYEPDDDYTQASWITTDGSVQEHTLVPIGESDYVKFNATLGTTYIIETSVDGVSDTYLYLYDQTGTGLIEGDDDGGIDLGSKIVWENDIANGTYYVLANDTYENGSSYTIRITQPDAYEPDDNYTIASVIDTDGSIQEHNFVPIGDSDYVEFYAELGLTYIIETSVDDVSDTYMFLYDSSMNLIDSDDDGGAGFGSRIQWTNDLGNGTYYAEISDAYWLQGGAYNVSVTVIPSLQLVSTEPTSDFGVSTNGSFNFSITVKCVGGTCMDVNLILDPAKKDLSAASPNAILSLVEKPDGKEEKTELAIINPSGAAKPTGLKKPPATWVSKMEKTGTPDEIDLRAKYPSKSLGGVLDLSKIDAGKLAEASKKVSEINLKIKNAGKKWKAGLTPLAFYSQEERDALLSVVLDSKSGTSHTMSSEGSMEILDVPAAFDWRDYNGQDWVTPIKDQGACGSCWAFAAVATVEGAFNVQSGIHDMDLDLSEQELVSCSDAGTCNGGYSELALDYIIDEGVVNETCFSYEASDIACELCEGDPVRTRIREYIHVENSTEAYKSALIEYGPFVVGLDAPGDFLYYAGGIYEPLEDRPWDGTLNHAITLVGYNDTNGSWIIKNSWGTGWGEDGYGRVYYGDLEQYDYGFAVTDVETAESPGVIPMNSGTPFYTLDENPFSCGNMTENSTCSKSWRVFATGENSTTWAFFVKYNVSQTVDQTESVYVTINDSIDLMSLSITSVNSTTAFLEWSAVSGVTSYKVYYSDNITQLLSLDTEAPGPSVSNITVLGTTWTDSGISGLRERYYRVSAVGSEEVLSEDSLGLFRVSVTEAA